MYVAGCLQGVTLVSFPASSAILKRLHGFSDAQYGAIFLPQVTMVILGSLLGGAVAARLGLRRLLAAALFANLVSQAALCASASLALEAAYASVLMGTACLGLGVGLSAAPLNSYPTLLFPARHDASIVAMHVAIGIGLSVGPVLAGLLAGAGLWAAFPAALAALCLVLVGVVLVISLPADAPARSEGSPVGDPPPKHEAAFWLFVGVVVLYALAEGTFANWVLIYLTEERGIAAPTAAVALSAFWGALTAGRVAVLALLLRFAARRIWMALPILMAAAFALLPLITTGLTGIAFFALAGLACSAFFPLSLSLATRRFPRHVAWVSSMLMAAMGGVGLSSFLIGPLRAHWPLARIYALSAAWPLFALGLIAILVRRDEAR